MADQKKFSDEYKDLDEKKPAKTDENTISIKLNKAESLYRRALDYLRQSDSVTSKQYFDSAIKILNEISATAKVDKNQRYQNLAFDIYYDYGSIFKKNDVASDESLQYIYNEKISKEVGKAKNGPKVNTINLRKDSTPAGVQKNEPSVDPRIAVMFPLGNTMQLVDNEFVQKNINFLTKDIKARKYFTKYLERSTRWFPLLKKCAAEESLPVEIIYLAVVESGLSPIAVSKANAVGMWQFIHTTGERYGLNANPSVWRDERRDPEKATRAAMRHLKDLYNEFGDWYLAMAAYNCGAGGVARAILKSKLEKPTFWELFNYLPKETRNYVPLYIAAVKICTQPQLYDFNINELNFLPEFAYDTVIINEPVHMNALAQAAGTTVDKIQELNTELIRLTTPPDGKDYVLKIPKGIKATFAENFAKLTPEEKQPLLTHVVQKKETLSKIAKEYGVSQGDIASINGLKISKKALPVGSKLKIPVQAITVQQRQLATAEKEEKSKVAKKEAVKIAEVAEKQHETQQQYLTHSVKKGETLFSIAQRYGLTLDELRKLNNLSPTQENIEAGSKLKIVDNTQPEVAEQKAPAQKERTVTKTVKHKVRTGETLARIADDYGVSIDEIRKQNKLKSRKLTSGQILKIRVESNEETVASKKTKTTRETGKQVVYKVKKGDNLSTIAAKYGVTEEQIQDWNSQTVVGNKVFSGTKLKIYSSASSKGSASATSKKVKSMPKTYTVQKGEKASTIASKFGIELKALRSKNKNVNLDKLKAGQKIRLQ